MENGNLEINSNEIMSAVSVLNEARGNLEALSSKVPGSFSILSELGLFPSLSKISSQIASLSASTSSLISKITAHEQDFTNLENELEQMVNDTSGFGTNNGSYGSSSDNYSGDYIEPENITVDSVNEGIRINTDIILDSITELTDSDKIKLIDFLKINTEGVEVSELLFNAENAGLLLKLLKKFYGDTSEELGKVELSEAENIQKVLLQKITGDNTNSSGQVEIEENSIIQKTKPYLMSIANQNNLTLTELVDNDSMYLKALTDLYDGNGLGNSDIDKNKLNEIRSEIDKIASDNNITVEDILGDPKYVSLLK